MNQHKQLALSIASILDKKLGQDIVVIDVGHLTSIADFFVIATGRNTQQVRALAEEVEDKLDEMHIEARRKEGYGASRWIVLDYASVIVHVFHAEERAYYNIERLWMDGSNQVAFTPEDQEEK